MTFRLISQATFHFFPNLLFFWPYTCTHISLNVQWTFPGLKLPVSSHPNILIFFSSYLFSLQFLMKYASQHQVKNECFTKDLHLGLVSATEIAETMFLRKARSKWTLNIIYRNNFIFFKWHTIYQNCTFTSSFPFAFLICSGYLCVADYICFHWISPFWSWALCST